MVWGQIAAAVAPTVLNKALGSGSKSSGGGGPSYLGFSSPGILAKPDEERGNIQVVETKERRALIDAIRESLGQSAGFTRDTIPQFQGAFGEAIGSTRDLLGQVTPGASALRDSRLEQLENARSRSMSDLRSNLSRRRIAGSSFGQQEQARQDLAFAQEGERIAAESFLQEMDLTNQLSQQLLNQEVKNIDMALKNNLSALEFERSADQFEVENQNYLAQLASGVASQATQVSQHNKQLEMELAAKNAAGAGEFSGFNIQSILGGLQNGSSGGISGGTFNWGGTTSSGGLAPGETIIWN